MIDAKSKIALKMQKDTLPCGFTICLILRYNICAIIFQTVFYILDIRETLADEKKPRLIKHKDHTAKRIQAAGAFPTALRQARRHRRGHRVKRRDKRTITSLCAFLGCLVLLIAGISVISANRPQQSMQGVITSSAGIVDLTGDYENVQADREAKELAAGPTPKPLYFQQGFEDENIAEIQQRLMDLGYMDNDEPTNYYGPNTKEAVEIFQRQHGVTVTGVVDRATYEKLFSDEALTYMADLGISGSDVEDIQSRLRELDYLDKVTGYFGEETEKAVIEFQKNNRLSVDGKVGTQTREMLYSEDAVPKSLKYGEKSDDVLRYQKRLNKLGYLSSTPDGTFGKDTVNAVKSFQRQNGLTVDGYIGPSTKELLMSRNAKASVISLGETSSSVTKIQKRLKELGYLKSSATGYFGTSTESAVSAFQKRNKLSSDGKVGKGTMAALFSSKAKKAPSNYKPSSGGSSSGSSSSGGGTGALTGTMGSVDRFISAAQSKIGCRYSKGGKGPDKFDCSGFVYWCLRQAGVNQKYLTSSGWRSVSGYTKVTSLSSLQRGDIIVFRGHVGIAMGDGTMIDASSGNSRVIHRSCMGDWSRRNFICAWRIF